MAKKIFATIIAIGTLSMPMKSLAQLDSAYALALQCNHAAMGVGSTEAAICLNYLLGVVGGANIDRAMFCPSARMLRGQIASLYVQHFKDHSELQGENRITAAYFALKAAMPCGRRGNPPIPPRRSSDPVDPRDTAYALMTECNVINANPVVCMNYLTGFVDG